MIAGAILASGLSRRFGGDKLTEKIHGKYLMDYTFQAVTSSRLEQVLVVYSQDKVGECAGEYGFSTLKNHNPFQGQSLAIKLATKELETAEALMFFMADQPLVSAEVIDKLLDAYLEHGGIIQPVYGQHPGAPVIFDRKYFKELTQIQGDEGGKGIIQRHIAEVTRVSFDQVYYGWDIDTIEDMKKVIEYLKE